MAGMDMDSFVEAIIELFTILFMDVPLSIWDASTGSGNLLAIFLDVVSRTAFHNVIFLIILFGGLAIYYRGSMKSGGIKL